MTKKETIIALATLVLGLLIGGGVMKVQLFPASRDRAICSLCAEP